MLGVEELCTELHHEVSRQRTTRLRLDYIAALPLGAEPGRRSWTYRALRVRIAESAADRALAADVVKRRHYLGRWPARPKTLILSYLADLDGVERGPAGCAALVMFALLPGNFHAARALGVGQLETLSLVRMWRADDLEPQLVPDFTPEVLRTCMRRVRADWTAKKLRPGGLRAEPRMVVTFSDPAVGHDGATYVAAGATDCGLAACGKRLFAWAIDPELRPALHRFGVAVRERAAA
jgi:hypothetical protein